jgi:hypothetical protein
MGVMRFGIHSNEDLENWPELDQAYLSGADRRVFPCRVERSGNEISVIRQTAESGKLHICWPVAGHGRPVVQTCSLPEREEPYPLPLELARGKISQLRNQMGAWQIAGMIIPKAFYPLNQQAHRLLAQAVQRQDKSEECARLSQQAIELAFEASDLMTNSYTQQRLEIYRRRSTQLPSLLGCNLGRLLPEGEDERQFLQAFNAATIPIDWQTIEPIEGEYDWDLIDRQVEWVIRNKLFIQGGPILDLTADGMPAWLAQWDADFLNLQSFVSDFIETAISRYFGKIRYWEISAYGNTGGALDLTEEQRLTLVARTLEVARQVDDEIQLSIRVEQPWGGYLSTGKHRLSPLHFIDAIVRSGVGLSSVNLEVAVGYVPRKTGYRDLLELSQLLDLWGSLGIPLQITLAHPSSIEEDPLALADVKAARADRNPSAEQQAEWVEQVVPLLMAKQPVVGVFWTNFSDSVPHRYPHSGMKDTAGQFKPAIGVFDRYLNQFWA